MAASQKHNGIIYYIIVRISILNPAGENLTVLKDLLKYKGKGLSLAKSREARGNVLEGYKLFRVSQVKYFYAQT